MYLSSRVTLTNITNTSTNATLTFHVLKFTDEKDYMCKLFYNDMFAVLKIRESEATRISVKGKHESILGNYLTTVCHLKKRLLKLSTPKNSLLTQPNCGACKESNQIKDYITEKEPNEKQHDQKTDNITLTCKASGNPKPSYEWYKEDNKSSILSTTDLYVIEDVIRKNSGVYICQAYNIINNIRYNHTTSVEIDIVDKLPSESVSSQISAVLLNKLAVQITHINVNKQPNQKQYDGKTDQINLTCTAIGNPEPEYIWFKQDNKKHILSRTNTYVIGDVNRNCSGIYICEAFNIINNTIYRNSYAVSIDIVHAVYAMSFTCTVVVVILCFAIRKRYCNRKKRNIHSDDQENISVYNNYAEIERISYHEVNPHNDRNEISNQPITEEEIVLENIPISTCTSSSENNITFSYLYVNTDIFNTNENRKVSAQQESIDDHSNGSGNCNIGVDNTIDSDNSGSDTLHVNQYVNTTSIRVPNVYEDLDHTTDDTHTYETPHIEGNTTCTE
ncbi:unnamed protein product [Mytilus edulis]|uniref:Ig-like domain-containing protein n=1 Tax=Mytilus edulis TaxID=6550 RepID=A0A8S3UXA1_MYTED|nr:unnamed protein product [Mytilus edulis]